MQNLKYKNVIRFDKNYQKILSKNLSLYLVDELWYDKNFNKGTGSGGTRRVHK
jgi:hypothetical protein